MPYKDKEKQLEYQRRWVADRRNEFFKNKQCQWCNSIRKLQLHHPDKNTKEDHKIWSWSKKRREEEVQKCIVLCRKCHEKHHAREKTIVPPNGYNWCSICKQFIPKDNFGPDKRRHTKLRCECNPCRKKNGWR